MLRRILSCRKASTLPAPPTVEAVSKQLNEEDLLAPVIAEDRIPVAFRFPSALGLLPMLAGSVCCAVCPHLGALLPLLPNITHATVMYTALHSSLHSGVHWGMACADMSQPAEFTKQYALAAAIPCILWSSLLALSVLPYSEARWIGGLAMLSVSYGATLGLDWLYTGRLGRLPVWYLPYKVWITVAALLSLTCLTYGSVRFPAVTIKPKPPHPVPSIHELVERN
jgi:hypothetical protein